MNNEKIPPLPLKQEISSEEEGSPRSPSPRTQQKNEDEWKLSEINFTLKYGHSLCCHSGNIEEEGLVLGCAPFDQVVISTMGYYKSLSDSSSGEEDMGYGLFD